MIRAMPVQNRLLADLPSNAFDSIRNECELVELATGDVLYEAGGKRIREVYFPTQSVVSLVAKAAADALLEVALVSDEGTTPASRCCSGPTANRCGFSCRSPLQSARHAGRPFKRMTDTQQALRDALNDMLDCDLRRSLRTPSAPTSIGLKRAWRAGS